MKKLRFALLVFLGVSAFLVGCSGHNQVNKNEENNKATEQEMEQNKNKNKESNNSMRALVGKKVAVKDVTVIDGDTIRFKEQDGQDQTVDFLLITTTNLHTTKPGSEKLALQATNFVREKLKNAKDLYIRVDGLVNEGSEIITKGYIYVDQDLQTLLASPDQKSLQEELLAQGLAKVKEEKVANIAILEKYKELEKEAKEKKIGVWGL